jgi:hypothetical protein
MLENLYRQGVRRGTRGVAKAKGYHVLCAADRCTIELIVEAVLIILSRPDGTSDFNIHNAYPGSSRRLPARNRQSTLTEITVDIK